MSSRLSGAARRTVLAAGSAGILSLGLIGLSPGPASATASADAFSLIERCSAASHSMSYSGTQFISIFGAPQTTTLIADIKHNAGEGTLLSIHATPTASAQQVWEQDADDESWSPSLSPGFASSGFSSPALALLKEHYMARVSGTAEVAGRRSHIVVLTRVGGGVAARMWLDDATSLPLRREVYDSEGRLARLTGYLDFSVKPGHLVTKKAAEITSPDERTLSQDEVAALREQGWAVPEHLGSLDLVEVRQQTSAEVVHLVYSDGLSTVSVFQQDGRFEPTSSWVRHTIAKHQLWSSTGMPGTVAWSAKGKVYTVVSDAGAPEMASMISGLPQHERKPSLLHRLHRGADRVMSWLNPFS